MNICGVAVTVDPDQYEAACSALAQIPGVEVSDGDYFMGLVVVVLSTDDLMQEIAGFRAIHAVPGLQSAELVCQFTDSQPLPDDCPLTGTVPPVRSVVPAPAPAAPLEHEAQ